MMHINDPRHIYNRPVLAAVIATAPAWLPIIVGVLLAAFGWSCR